MFGGFKKGYRIYLNRAKFVIDKFHVILNLNKALDKVRRSEYAKNKSIKHLRYSILKNKENLTTKDIKRIENLKKENSLTCKAYSLKESFSEFYKNQTKEEARKFYDIWASNLKKDNIPAFNTLIKTLSKNMKNILG
jgi:transposase